MKRAFCCVLLNLLILTGCAEQARQQRITIGVMPKLVGIDYFNTCEKGALEAGKALGVDIVYDGPITNDVTKQAEMIDTWITRRLDVITVAPNDPNALSPTLKKAMARGIKVLTWDADSEPDSRHYFVNQATYEGIGYALVDVMAEEIGGKGDVAIITGSLTAANQNIWMDWMRKRVAEAYPELNIVTVKPSEEDQQMAFQVAQDLLKAYPNLKGIWGITSVAFPGAARAVRESGYAGKVAVTGLSTPGAMREYVKDGTVKTVLLWNPVDLGYLTVYAAKKLLDTDRLPAEFEAGRLGKVQVKGNEILLGPPMRFTQTNIDDFDF
jgi:rhamnose transport system substrate-binding protein